jgi:serine/threonine protein kinase
MLHPAAMFVCPECGRTFPLGGFCTEDGTTLADRAGDLLLGQVVGSYRVASVLGRGGMGVVYKAVHPGIGSRVAIKLLNPECVESPALVERFFAEARAVNVIRHEAIVNVLDLASLPDGRPYIVMEYLDGSPLSGYLAKYGPLPLGTLCKLVLQVLDGLAAAHEKGIVHRDLKPDNLYITSGARVKILDFGIAKLRPDMTSSTAETRAGSVLGTPQYMSPEQAMGQPVDHRCDLYSVGVILFEGTTGQRPFPATTLYELLKAHVELMPPAPSLLRPDVPRQLENVLLHALQKDPGYRSQSARDFQTALEHSLQFLPPESFAPLGGAGSSAHIPTLGSGAASAHTPYAMSQQPYAPTPMPITHPGPYLPTNPPLVPPPTVDNAANATKQMGWALLTVVFIVIALVLGSCAACICTASFDGGGS